MIEHEWTPGTRKAYDELKAEKNAKLAATLKELAWAWGVIGRYEARMQAMADEIAKVKAAAVARLLGREPSFAEMLGAPRHIETERYEEAQG